MGVLIWSISMVAGSDGALITVTSVFDVDFLDCIRMCVHVCVGVRNYVKY